MDFFDVIEEFENKMSEDIKKRLMINLHNQANLTQQPQSNVNNNKLFEEISSSKVLTNLIAEKKKKNKKVFILALNSKKKKANNCFNQVGFNNDYFYCFKTECSYMKRMLLRDITNELESLFQREKKKSRNFNTHNTINTMRMLNPLKMTKINRYREESANNSILNNVKKKNENMKEDIINRIKQENIGKMIKKMDQLVLDDNILIQTNEAKKKFNFPNKYEAKGKNKKRILSCRVVIQKK